jgi:chromosome segregation ATPase
MTPEDREQVEYLLQANRQLSEQLASFIQQAQSAMARGAELERERDKLKEILERALQSKDTVEAERDAARARVEGLLKEIESHRAHVKHLEDSRDGYEAERNALRQVCLEEAENLRQSVFQTEIDLIEKRLRKAGTATNQEKPCQE